jgi:hypothetical protein
VKTPYNIVYGKIPVLTSRKASAASYKNKAEKNYDKQLLGHLLGRE